MSENEMCYPKISIITVSYNAVATIEQTILSVINQTYENIEYIIIDGGSTDGTIDIIKKYKDKISYWVSEQDNGIYDAMNKGIDVATGDYIQFLNADDCLVNKEIIKIVKERRENQELIDINSHDSDGFSAIIVAIEYKNNELLKILIENGADIYEKHPIFDRLTLHTACYYENEEAVELILKTHPKLINVRSGHDGWSPLHDAVLKSNSEIVKILLKYGADPMIKDNSGGTPMDMATEFGKGEIVKLLRDEIKKRRK